MTDLPARCLFTGWILAWAVIVFLPGIPLALLANIQLVQLPGAVWRSADDISPWVKLSLGGQLLLFFWLHRRQKQLLPLSVLSGLVSVLTVLSFMPAALSRGYGVVLTGARYELTHTVIYLAAAVCGGVAYAIVKRRCEASV